MVLGIDIERVSIRSYKVKTIKGGIYIRNRKFITIRYTDLSKVYKPQRTTEHPATAHTQEDPGKLQEDHKD